MKEEELLKAAEGRIRSFFGEGSLSVKRRGGKYDIIVGGKPYLTKVGFAAAVCFMDGFEACVDVLKAKRRGRPEGCRPLWVRLGAYVYATDGEIEGIRSEDLGEHQAALGSIASHIKDRGFEINGDAYVPDNDEEGIDESELGDLGPWPCSVDI